MDEKQLIERLNDVKAEYKKIAIYELIHIFMLIITLWAALLGVYWLAYLALLLQMFFIYLRMKYIHNLYK